LAVYAVALPVRRDDVIRALCGLRDAVKNRDVPCDYSRHLFALQIKQFLQLFVRDRHLQ
jgi:hypothetical protein